MSARGRPEAPTAGTLQVAAGALTCAASIALLAAAAAASIRSSGLTPGARAALGFSFRGVERAPGEALRIGVDNGRLAIGVLLCALVVGRLPSWTRGLVDLVLVGLLAINAAAIGVALAAYGTRLVSAVAPHLPLELAALSLSGGAYMTARGRALPLAVLARVGALCLLLLAAAATLETYVSLGGGG